MTELSRQKRAAITKRSNTRNALLDAAEAVFTDSDYQGIKVEHVASYAVISTATFYSTFSGKSTWASAILDKRLDEGLAQRVAPTAETHRTPRARLLGHFGLLAEVSSPFPGITKALVDERADEKAQYSNLLPRYYRAVTQAFADGHEQHDFRVDMTSAHMADFALDSLALAYAVHLDNPAARAMYPSLILGGLSAETNVGSE